MRAVKPPASSSGSSCEITGLVFSERFLSQRIGDRLDGAFQRQVPLLAVAGMAVFATVPEDVPLDILFDDRPAILIERVPQDRGRGMPMAIKRLSRIFDTDLMTEPLG